MRHEPTRQARRARALLAAALTAFFALASTPAVAQGGTIYYVDRDATGADDGSSWTDAFTSPNDALGVAAAGAQIWVAEGVYYPDEGTGRTDNEPGQWFIVPNGVQLYGGFAGGETLLAQRDFAAHKTILSGDIDQNDDAFNSDGNFIDETYADIAGTNSDGVLEVSFADSTTRIDGFVITGGNTGSSGGGIYTAGSSAGFYNLEVRGNRAVVYGGGMVDYGGFPHLEHVVFGGNYASGSYSSMGGGMAHVITYESAGHPVLVDVTFAGNEAFEGGGIGFQGGSATIRSCTFTDNKTVTNNISGPAYGGGFSAWDASAIDLDDVIFERNQATRGGAMYMFRSGTFTVTNALFNQNTVGTAAGNSGGGVYAVSGPLVTVAQAVFTGNTAWTGGGFGAEGSTYSIVDSLFIGNRASYGAGLSGQGGSVGSLTNVTFNANQWFAIEAWAVASMTITNSILWGDAGGEIYDWPGFGFVPPTVTYSDVQGGWAGAGNINTDPLFVGGGSLRLQIGSPAIDAGNSDALPADAFDLDGDGNVAESLPVDLDGNARHTGSAVDMGAYEYTAGATPTVGLLSAPNPSVVGASVTLTATVTSDSGTPTGSVTFTEGATALPSCVDLPLSGGAATCEVTSFTVGTHALSVRYSGDESYVWGSDSLDHVVLEETGGTEQTITFDNPGDQLFGTTPTLTATTSSGLTVTFSSTAPAVCTITGGGTLTFVTTGTCSIDANQPGDATYAPAPTVTQSFSVLPMVPGAPAIGTASTTGSGTATVPFTAPAADGGATIDHYRALSNPPGHTGTGSGSPIVVTGLTNGTTYTFTVQAHNEAGYGPPSGESNPVTPRGTQTITFVSPVGNQHFGTSPELAAMARPSGLPVTFTSATPGVCTVHEEDEEEGLFYLSFGAAGTCTIHADQAGNAGYLPAPTATLTFQVLPVPPGIPTDVVAVAGNRQATVSFVRPTSTGGRPIQSYLVRSIPDDRTLGVDATTATIDGLTNGVSYTFIVRASNGVLWSEWSEPSEPVTPRGPQTIAFAAPAGKTFGDAPFALSATATSELPVTFELTGNPWDPCSLDTPTGMVTITGAGSCTLTARQAGNEAWEPAEPVTRTLTIARANADCTTVTGYAGNYDGSQHEAGGWCTGVGGVKITGGHSARALTPLATPVAWLDLGNMYKNVPGGTAHWMFHGALDYNDQSGDVPIQIEARPLTLTANDQGKLYGQTFSFTGGEFHVGPGDLVGSDSISKVSLSCAGAAAAATAGNYPIAPSAAVFSTGLPGNYAITYVAGNMNVIALVLTVTPHGKSVRYSDPNPTFTFDISGFENGDDESDLTTLPTCVTTRTPLSPPNAYPITCSGGVDDVYTFVYDWDELTVREERATITYTGDTQVTTRQGSASVTLAASLEEEQDGNLGAELAGRELLFEVFTFYDQTYQDPIASCAETVGGVLDGKGTAHCSVDLPAADPYQVRIRLLENDYYTADRETAVVLVNAPVAGATAGGGWQLDPSLDSRANFGFNVKFQKKGKVQGGSLYVFRLATDLSAILPGAPAGVRAYDWVVKSNVMSSLNLYGCEPRTKAGCRATFTGKSNVSAVDRLTGISYGLGGNYRFQVDVEDNGEPGSPDEPSADAYAIRVWTEAGTYYASGDAYDENGALLAPLPIEGGNVQVRAK